MRKKSPEPISQYPFAMQLMADIREQVVGTLMAEGSLEIGDILGYGVTPAGQNFIGHAKPGQVDKLTSVKGMIVCVTVPDLDADAIFSAFAVALTEGYLQAIDKDRVRMLAAQTRKPRLLT